MILKNMSEQKKAIFYDLIATYNTKSFTHSYIFGYVYNKSVCFTIVNNPNLADFTYLDESSKGKGDCIKYRPNAEQKEKLHNINCTILCAASALENMFTTTNYNRGECFERLIFQHFGQAWKKDNIKFTDGGDITINGMAYQIKFNKASFINQFTADKLNGIERTK